MKSIGRIIVFVALSLFFASAKAENATESSSTETVLFKSGDCGYHTFRIPALVVGKDGGLIAFAEGRKNGAHDRGSIDILARRSKDAGKTWSEPQKVVGDGVNTFGNPQPILIENTGDIVLVFSWNLGEDPEDKILARKSKDRRRAFTMRSSDFGGTWSKPVEITDSVMDENDTWFASGPGGGIEIDSGKYKGRLAAAIDIATSNPVKYWAGCILSDDGGKTWRRSELVPYAGANESQVAQLDADTLVLNMRVQGRAADGSRLSKYRVVAFSGDGGATWSKAREDTELTEPICQGAFVSQKNSSDSRKGERTLAFCNPDDPKERKNLTLKITDSNTYKKWIMPDEKIADTDAKHWKISRVVCPTGSGYSDMKFTPDGDIAVFYERGLKKKTDYFGEIVFTVIPNPYGK